MSFEKPYEQYEYMRNLVRLYNQLQDGLSKEIFWARLKFEAEPNLDRALTLGALSNLYPTGRKESWRDEFRQVASAGKKVVLYGAGVRGQTFANLILNSGEDFYAFCDRNKSGKTICGKVVLSPEEIILHAELYAVVVCTTDYYREILQYLHEHSFPEDSVLYCSKLFMDKESATQYRDFPELFRRNTAIVDAGCYDGMDTIMFYHWCNGMCSKIYAFEPDENNFRQCKINIDNAKIPNVSLIQAGLSNTTGEAAFASASNMGSYLVCAGQIKPNFIYPEAKESIIRTLQLDDIADTEIGLIKMDIEGAEFDALHGAKTIIQRDKPLLAVCVYHRQGDLIAIMDYLQELVPEYRFWLRHYEALGSGTVLYASL